MWFDNKCSCFWHLLCLLEKQKATDFEQYSSGYHPTGFGPVCTPPYGLSFFEELTLMQIKVSLKMQVFFPCRRLKLGRFCYVEFYLPFSSTCI